MSSIFNKIIPGKGEKKEKKKEPEKKPVKTETKNQTVQLGGFSKKSFLVQPWITEKARNLEVESKYVFEIIPKANKSEVKKEIEQRYGVVVTDVNIIKKRSRPKRFKNIRGGSKITKKAVVTLKEGDKLEIFPV